MPFVDLGCLHAELKEAILDELSELIDRGSFTGGPQVARFERAFAAYCGTAACVGVASGLDALRLALLAAGLEPGDEVIVPAMTFVATLEAVAQAGGTPVPVDVDPDDHTLDLAAVAAAIGPRTRFLLPVHLYGQMADVRGLRRLARERGLTLIEDACQAHGARRDGVRAGAAGLAAAFSFYPAKNLGAFGDAGAVVTDDPELAEDVRALREHGQRGKYRHELAGWTARLDTVQAVALLHKLPLLDGWNDERRAVAARYESLLEGVGDLRLPRVPAGSEPVWHLYVVRTADPDALAAHLARRGIQSGRHYPEPVHLAPAFRSLGHGPGSFPAAEALARENLSLPLFPGMREEQLERVAEAVEEHFRDGGGAR
ncbi:MAG TPA: DegT/DnrJ/EryC1/StrS family aminotransferase [Gaiellaceae bacterium]|nr:DegT/DnrJ/EryC1/StrS family aminotransferase [Gaiellaceae bacterium]